MMYLLLNKSYQPVSYHRSMTFTFRVPTFKPATRAASSTESTEGCCAFGFSACIWRKWFAENIWNAWTCLNTSKLRWKQLFSAVYDFLPGKSSFEHCRPTCVSECQHG